MYLFCKFGFLYIGFTLSFSTEAFWAVLIGCQTACLSTELQTSACSLSIFWGTTQPNSGQNTVSSRAAGAEGRLTAANTAWDTSMSWMKKNHNCLWWNEAVFMLSNNSFFNGSYWTVFCNLWNSMLCFVKRFHERVDPWKPLFCSVPPQFSQLPSRVQRKKKKKEKSESFMWRVVFWSTSKS